MKKLFSNKKVRAIGLVLIGIIIGGSIGITATTYVLQANEIEYKNNKSVQEAIEELYTMAQNSGGSTGTLPIGDPTVKSIIVRVPYVGTYDDIKCLYGTDDNYGIKGSASSNICEFIGTAGNQTLYYKIIATNNDGKIYENSEIITTGSETNVVKSDIPTGTKTIIYLDPTDLSATCNEANSTVGGAAKSGCMKWYAFKEDSTSYTMILDHNTKSQVAWNSDNDNTTMKEVKTELNNLVSNTKWKVTPRLIKAQEIANITGISCSTGAWGYVSFKGLNTPSDYYWLYDYTYDCINNGCKVADSNSNNYGYWTDTPHDSHSYYVRTVAYHGNLILSEARSMDYGLRPVITVSKSNF